MPFILFLLAGALVYAALGPLLVIAAFAAVVWVAARIAKAYGLSLQLRRDRIAAVVARADRQHQQIMSGDEIAGTYGDYLPPPELRETKTIRP